MSNYTKTTNFTVKDTALVTDPQKVLRGAEFDTEFNNIATAINSKYDADSSINIDGGTLTGSVLEEAVLNGSVSGSAVLDDDTFGTASSTTLATSESIKAYVDSVEVAGITSTATEEQAVLTDTSLLLKGNLEVNGNITSGGAPIGNGGTTLPDATIDGATLRWNNTSGEWEQSSWLKVPFGTGQGDIQVTLTTITAGGDIFNSRGDGVGLSFGVNQIWPIKNAITSDNATDLGGETKRFKDGHFAGSVYSNGSPLTRTQDLIEALSTLRAATLDESVDVRQALTSACDKLIEKFEAMGEISQ